MRILTLADASIHEVVEVLKSGLTIVYPTETCYGLGCDAANSMAVERVFTIKGREKQKAVLMLASSVAMVKQYVVWSPTAERLAREYWPGALTMVLPLRPDQTLSDLLVGPERTVAFRVTSHEMIRSLVEALGRPLISTSANRSGGQNPYSIAAVQAELGQSAREPDMMIDAGELPVRPPSTIVRVVGDTIEIVRQGEVHISLSL